MSGVARRVDANFTGLRFAEEAPDCIGTLPGQVDRFTNLLQPGMPIWMPIEPNSYGEFGVTVSKTSRTPIRTSRQREFGVVTDLDATANFQIDFTQDNLYELFQGFFFADWRIDATPEFPIGTASVTAADTISGTGIEAFFAVGDVVNTRGFNDPANNTAFIVTDTSTPDQITVATVGNAAATLVVEATNPLVEVKRVGVQFAMDDIATDVSASFPALTSTVFDFTTLNLFPGQWIYIGGDAAGSAFTAPENNGFARVRSVTANRLELGKTQNTFSAETGVGVTLQLFIGDLIRNEFDPELIITRSYQFERSLATAGFEYVIGAVANTMTINLTNSDKITVDMAFQGIDGFAIPSRLTVGAVDERNPTQPELDAAEAAGQFPELQTSAIAFNTASDFTNLRIASRGAAPQTLFAFLTDFTLTINNNVTPTKSVAVLGAFDQTVGDFVAEGNITAYFASTEAQTAVRENAQITIDMAIAQGNVGWVFDIPLLSLGEGRLNVAKDESITIPVSIEGARDFELDTTLQAAYFDYLPTVAEA